MAMEMKAMQSCATDNRQITNPLPRLESPWRRPCSDEILFEILLRRASFWMPAIDIRGIDIKARIHSALQSRAEWMIHPCVNIFTLQSSAYSERREFLLAFWTLLHDDHPSGEVWLKEPAWAWTPGGGFAVSIGHHRFADLIHKARDVPRAPLGVEIDVWSDSVGIALDSPTPGEPIRELPQTVWDREQLVSSVATVLRSLCFLKQALPECLDWVRTVTKVIVLLPRLPGLTRNWSRQDVPGLIYTTVPHDMLEILDTIVHESAHRCLFCVETIGPIVTAHDPAVHRSPLRKDLRPLRGIIIAWHAIVYMAALYAGLERSGMLRDDRVAHRLARLHKQHAQCAETVGRSPGLLTSFGRLFVNQIEEIANHAFL
jgi:hypothetical protein